MYIFRDKSDRKLCLRPEFTSSVLRAFLNNKSYSHTTKSLYYVAIVISCDRSMEARIVMNDHSMVGIASFTNLGEKF